MLFAKVTTTPHPCDLSTLHSKGNVSGDWSSFLNLVVQKDKWQEKG